MSGNTDRCAGIHTPRFSSCVYRCPAITCPPGSSRVSARSPDTLVAAALHDTTPFTGIREAAIPKRNTARFFVHRISSFVGPKSFPFRRFRHFDTANCKLETGTSRVARPSPRPLGESLPPKRPSALQPLQPPPQRRKRQPLRPQQQPSLRPHVRPSYLRPLIEPEQRPFLVLHLRPDPYPILVPQQPPVLLPYRHPHQALQQHPFRVLQRRSLQFPFQTNQQPPRRPSFRLL